MNPSSIKERDYENVKREQRTNPSSRIQERTRHVIKNSRSIYSSIFYIPVTFPLLFFYEPIIKNSRMSRIQEGTCHKEFKINIFFRLLHSHYFSFRNEPIIKNSRTNPSSRIQRHQEFKILRECKTGTKKERTHQERTGSFFVS